MPTTPITQTAVYETRRSDAVQPADWGRLVLRLALGLMLLLHGVSKLKAGGLDPVIGLLGKHGLPSVLAYGTYVGEIAAPVFLIAGYWTRAAALVIAFNMLVALALAHTAQLFTLGPQGGWALELQGFYLFTAVAMALLGAGRISVGGLQGRWN